MESFHARVIVGAKTERQRVLTCGNCKWCNEGVAQGKGKGWKSPKQTVSHVDNNCSTLNQEVGDQEGRREILEFGEF